MRSWGLSASEVSHGSKLLLTCQDHVVRLKKSCHMPRYVIGMAVRAAMNLMEGTESYGEARLGPYSDRQRSVL